MVAPGLIAEGRRFGALLLATLSLTCARRDLTCEPKGSSSPSAPIATPSSSGPAPAASSAAPPQSTAAPASWADAVRLEDWESALSLIASLDDSKRSSAEVRYVGARANLALKRYAEAAALLESLETQLPELSEDIAFHRAEAQLHAGPKQDAATYFASRTSVEELVKAAVAFEQTGEPKRARDVIEKAIRATRGKHDSHAVQAREIRARLAEAEGQKAQAIADWKFVAKHAGFADQADDAVDAIRRLDPTQVPTASDRMARAARLAHGGDPEQALDELDRVATAPGKSPSQGDLLMARAKATYGTRARYEEAAQLFEQAARIQPSVASEALYFAAKAWSRADNNDRGRELYGRVAARFPRTSWGDRASYQRARLLRLEGRWADAASAYASYLSAYRRGSSVKEARYEHALCLLLAGQAKDARARLNALAGDERNRSDAAAIRELVGVAAHAAKDTAVAIATWRSIIEQEPLSFAAAAAAARLRDVGQSPPPPITPGPTALQEPLHIPLPRTAKLLHGLGLEADAEAWLADNEDALTRPYQARSAEARCVLYENLERSRQRYRVGQRYAPLDLVMSAPTAATRWAWDCLYPAPYPDTVGALEARYGIPRGLVYAVIRQESGFNPDARSPVGAQGLMQLMPATAEKTAARLQRPWDDSTLCRPGTNVELGATYLGLLLRTFGGSVPLAVAAYNAGPKAVAGWKSHAGSIPVDVFTALIPYRETRHYVWRVMGNYARYAFLAGGVDGIPAMDLAPLPAADLPEDVY